MGGVAVGEGDNAEVGVGWVCPEQATNRKRRLILAKGLIFFIIAPYFHECVRTGFVSLIMVIVSQVNLI